ncbi:Uma2 family endonuclease [Kibdelosporangium lantanae]|uniref:Uma2 family endonuclease n=1 Tax=Kibdelosporangium lantanae TaxID=1497396 RepID=A0ABW3M4G5_9PSEU
MSAALRHPIGPYTVEDWLAMDPPPDGSRLELVLGYLHVTPRPSGQHQYVSSCLVQWLRAAFKAEGRRDLYVVPEVGVRISTPWRAGLIPDVVVLTRRPDGADFAAGELALVAEVWSPGNTAAERETKMAAYAGAGVPFVWTVDQGHDLAGLTLTAFRLTSGQYVVENKAQADGPTVITAAPVPVTLDLAQLLDYRS